MNAFLLAHGYDPGPTQRPTTAGALTGLLAAVPAVPVLAAFGSLAVEARILGWSATITVASGMLAMAVAGGLYGRTLQRAANDRRGGWLFGMAYGFLLWAAGAVMLLPIAGDGTAPAGKAAIGIALSLLVWGTALGALFPSVHRAIHANGARGLDLSKMLGPAAAAARPGAVKR